MKTTHNDKEVFTFSISLEMNMHDLSIWEYFLILPNTNTHKSGQGHFFLLTPVN